MDQRHFKEQKRFEADLARQSSIIAAEAALLDELSTALWDFMLSMIAVSFYACNGDLARATTAFDDYQAKSASRFGHLRALFSKAHRFLSTDRTDELQALYRTLLSLDVALLHLRQTNAPIEQWREHHERAFGAQLPVTEALTHIAEDMRLTPKMQP